MKKIVKVRDGQSVPDHYVYVKSEKIAMPEESYERWESLPGLLNNIPGFERERLYRYTPVVLFHFYEVSEATVSP